MDLDMQVELFEQAIQELEADPDLINQVLEITSASALALNGGRTR